MSLSDYAENKVIDHVLKVDEFTQPTLYVALCTGSISDAMTGATLPEVADANNYERVAAGAFDAAASRASENTADISWPQSTGAQGTISHWALVDSATHGAGNMIAYGAFTTPKSIANGNTAKILAGDMDITVNAGGMSDYLADDMLDHILGTAAYTVPTNIYAGLSTGSIADDSTGATIDEPTDLSYARKLHNSWTTGSAGSSHNFGALTFATATGSWGTIEDTFLADALTAGNVLFHGDLGASQAITVNDILEFASGSFAISID